MVWQLCLASKRSIRRLERNFLLDKKLITNGENSGMLLFKPNDICSNTSVPVISVEVLKMYRAIDGRTLWKSLHFLLFSFPTDTVWMSFYRLLRKENGGCPCFHREYPSAIHSDRCSQFPSMQVAFNVHGHNRESWKTAHCETVWTGLHTSSTYQHSSPCFCQTSYYADWYITFIRNSPRNSQTCHRPSSNKKAGLDLSDPASCRPVSNLSFVLKLVERVVHKQISNLWSHTNSESHNLLAPTQSGFNLVSPEIIERKHLLSRSTIKS